MITICKASAGSGKTFKITHEYLKLILPSPHSYPHILAVTFTNKATEEMKHRIIQELNTLSKHPTQSHHTPHLIEELGLTAKEISLRAAQALRYILFDYGRFNISTIDSFFQQAIRSFIRELGIYGGYKIEMEQKKVLQESIDSLFARLDEQPDSQLYDWLARFYDNQSESGSGWNIKNEIAKLGDQLFRDHYKKALKHYPKPPTHEELDASLNRIKELQKEFEETLQRHAQKLLRALEQEGFDLKTDFHNKSKTPLTGLTKIASAETFEMKERLLQMANELEVWTGKTNGKSRQIETFFNGTGGTILREMAAYYLRNAEAYNSAVLILKNIYVLGILSNVKQEIDRYASENNTLIMSQTAELLNGIIDGSTTPFVYEKLATRILHYMIDEFQDTSDIQWNNFRPLIHESLAVEGTNLIVGDVKQSIYRWRDSNWQLLADALPAEFPDYLSQTLDDNRRSKGNIIRFNNLFFERAARQIQNKLTDEIEDNDNQAQKAYADVRQNNPSPQEEQNGYLEVRLLDREAYLRINPNADPESKRFLAEEFVQTALSQLPSAIEELGSKGYRGGDIGILVRYKREARRVVSELLKYRQKEGVDSSLFNILSPEGLLLSNAHSVALLIAVFHYLCAPNAPLTQTFVDDKGEIRRASELLASHNIALAELLTLPLYQLTERLISLFVVDRYPQEQPFFEAFQDLVFDFVNKQSSDINSFILWWQEDGLLRTVQMPEDNNAIRIMTVHASKGLAFKAVIVPFANWEFTKPGNSYLWCVPQDPRLNISMPVPIRAAKNALNTEFKEEYQREMLHTFIDGLNSAYVAFTRAQEAMIIFSEKKSYDKGNTFSDLADLLNDYLGQTSGDPTLQTYTEGNQWKALPTNEEKNYQTADDSTYHSIDPSDRIHIKLKGAEYLTRTIQQMEGIRLHDILGRVITANDLDHALSEIVKTDFLSDNETETLRQQVASILAQPLAQEWFDGSHEVINERNILLGNNGIRRPDRIMIRNGKVTIVDYKFTTSPLPKHKQQVEEYLDLFQQMGYKETFGFVWYPFIEEVVGV